MPWRVIRLPARPLAQRWIPTKAASAAESLTPALETDAAQALDIDQRVTLVATTETDAAQVLNVDQKVTLVAATETSVAQALVVKQSVTITAAVSTETAQALNVDTRVAIVAATEIDSVDQTNTYGIADSDHDGTVFAEGVTWPPTPSSVDTTSDTVEALKRFSIFTDYSVHVGLFRWDTSSIPDDATVTSAIFEFVVVDTIDDESPPRVIQFEWYEPGTIGTEDYALNVDGTAHNGVALSEFPILGDTYQLELLNPQSVNKSGFTGLRMVVEGDEPASETVIEIASFDDTFYHEPRLVVTYIWQNVDKRVTLTPATEADSASQLVLTTRVNLFDRLVASTEVAVALSVAQEQAYALTPATETDVAQALVIKQHVTITPAISTETAAAAVELRAFTPANETDTAIALVLKQLVTLTSATSAESARPLTTTKTILKTLIAATSIETVAGLEEDVLALTPVTEADIAVTLSHSGMSDEEAVELRTSRRGRKGKREEEELWELFLQIDFENPVIPEDEVDIEWEIDD